MAEGKIAWATTHVGTKRVAARLASEVVASRLAACANLGAIESTYWWKGKVVRTGEVAVLFKTSPAKLDRLVARIAELHPYNVPFIAWGKGERVPARYARRVNRETGAGSRRAGRGAGRRGLPRTR